MTEKKSSTFLKTVALDVDTLMSIIGDLAHETGCPDGTPPIEWIREMAEIGHMTVTMAPVTIERLSEEDMTRIRATPVRPGAVIALPPSYWSLSGDRLRSMLEKAWDAGMATDYWHDQERDLATRKRDVDAILSGESARPTVDGVPAMSVDELPVPERMARYAAARGKTVDDVLSDPNVLKVDRPTVDGVPAMSIDELPNPADIDEADGRFDAIENERIEASLHHTFAGLGPIERIPGEDGSLFGWTILGRVQIHRSTLPVDFSGETESEDFRRHRQELLDIVRGAYMAGRYGPTDPKPSASLDVEIEEVWSFDPARPRSFVTTRQDLFHTSDEAGEPRQPGDVGKVETIRQRQASLDAAFAPYAAVEGIIRDAVPVGTTVTRACAGGEIGWRIGAGWMCVEGTDATKPDLLRACAQSLAAIPVPECMKPKAGDPDVVCRTLAAVRAM